jgi:hypothetical protein
MTRKVAPVRAAILQLGNTLGPGTGRKRGLSLTTV